MHDSLITNKYKRLFVFGCSYTCYKWPTWADILADNLGIEYYNLAEPGLGNDYIFYRVVEADLKYKFSNTDLIIIVYSMLHREVRYMEDRYHDIDLEFFDQVKFPKTYKGSRVPSFNCDRGLVLKSLSMCRATEGYLNNTNATHFKFSLTDYTLENYLVRCSDGAKIDDVFLLFKEFLDEMPMSFMHFQENIGSSDHIRCEGLIDWHPTPYHHYMYLRNIIIPEIKKRTIFDVIIDESVAASLDYQARNCAKINNWSQFEPFFSEIRNKVDLL